MTRLLLLVLLVALGTPVAADQVRVRSVELGGSTRLTIDLPEPGRWTAGPTEDGYAVNLLGRNALTLDVGPFLRSSRGGRIAFVGLDETASRVTVGVGCKCRVQVSQTGGDSLELEIFDINPSSDSSETAKTPSGTKDIAVTRALAPEFGLGIEQVESVVSGGVSPAPAIDTPPDVSGAAPRLARPQEPAIGSGDEENSLPLVLSMPPLTGSERVFEFEHGGSFAVEMLSRELSRAIAQGLVDVPDTSTPLPLTRDLPETSGLSEGQSNLVVTTAVDRDVDRRIRATTPTTSGSVCLPDTEFEITEWSDSEVSSSFGRLRRSLYADDGTPSQTGMIAMARYYVALGFGAEALVLIDHIEDVSRREILSVLAEIVENGRSKSRFLDGQFVCPGKVALWSILARDIPVSERPEDTSHILAAFSELPLHLRVHLGPFLSKRLQDLGFQDGAQIALNAVTRGGSTSPAQQLTAARLGLSGTAPAAARNSLVSLASGTDIIAAQALLELLLDAERNGKAPQPSWVEDAPSLVRATQGSEIAAELNLAGLRGQIALGQFDSLRKALAATSPGLNEDTRRELAGRALAAAAETSDLAQFLRTEIAFSDLADIESMAPENRIGIAEKLIDLGLPERASRYLPEAPRSDRERRVIANVLSELGQVGDAVRLLSDGTSKETKLELGRTLLRNSRLSEAVVAFEGANDIESASGAAIRNGDWDWVQIYADESLSEATRDLTRALGSRTEDVETGNVDLLEEASRRRSQATFLLETITAGSREDAFTN